MIGIPFFSSHLFRALALYSQTNSFSIFRVPGDLLLPVVLDPAAMRRNISNNSPAHDRLLHLECLGSLLRAHRIYGARIDFDSDSLPSRCLPHFVAFSSGNPRISLRTADHGATPVVNPFVYGRFQEMTSILLRVTPALILFVYERLQEMTTVLLHLLLAL
jgi:hypothetical protein